MTPQTATDGSKFDWEDARRRLTRLAHTLDAAGSTTPDQTRETLDKRARELAKPLRHAVAVPDMINTLAFRIGPDTYALETAFILEITNLASLTIVPGCPAFLRGIMNLRGEILAVMDLSLLFQLSPACAGNRLLVLGHERPQYGLLIDDVDQVKELSRSDIALPAVGIPEIQRQFLLGVLPNATLVLSGATLLSDSHFTIDEA